jgi:hypothetical protein
MGPPLIEGLVENQYKIKIRVAAMKRLRAKLALQTAKRQPREFLMKT